MKCVLSLKDDGLACVTVSIGDRQIVRSCFRINHVEVTLDVSMNIAKNASNLFGEQTVCLALQRACHKMFRQLSQRYMITNIIVHGKPLSTCVSYATRFAHHLRIDHNNLIAEMDVQMHLAIAHSHARHITAIVQHNP